MGSFADDDGLRIFGDHGSSTVLPRFHRAIHLAERSKGAGERPAMLKKDGNTTCFQVTPFGNARQYVLDF
jgi:hypothetical protein